MALTSYSWEKRRPSLAFSRSMWSARSTTGMGGCSLIPRRARGWEGERREWDLAVPTSDMHIDLHTGGTTRWVRLPVGPWGGCVTVRWVHFVQQCMTRGEREREGRVWKHTSWNRLVTFGDIVMLSEEDRGGAGTAMRMRDWVSMLLEGSRRQTSLWLHNAQLVTEVGSERETHSSLYKSVTLSLPGEEKKKPDWSPAKSHFFENLFPNNRLSFGAAWSTWAGLISNNPPAAL